MTLDDVAAVVFSILDDSLGDGLAEFALEHRARIYPRDASTPHEQWLEVGGQVYRIAVDAVT